MLNIKAKVIVGADKFADYQINQQILDLVIQKIEWQTYQPINDRIGMPIRFVIKDQVREATR